MKGVIQIVLILIGLVPLLLHGMNYQAFTWLLPYIRIPYSLIISFYSLGYFYVVLSGKRTPQAAERWLNTSILLFFILDAFLATGTTFLIKEEYLRLVAWFWFVRALFLQFFYGCLIYYGYRYKPSE